MKLPTAFGTLLCLWTTLLSTVTAMRIDPLRHTTLENTDYIYVYCYWDNPSSTISWSLVSSSGGQVTDIGTCRTDKDPATSDYCDTPALPNIVIKRELRTHGYLKISDVTRDYSGVYVCTEHRVDGTSQTANCTVDVVPILVGSNDCRERLEDVHFTISCLLSEATRGPITWSLHTPSGETVLLGTCDDVNDCTSPLSPYIQAMQTRSGQSSLTIAGLKRETAGTVVCSNGTVSDNCSLDVIVPATVRNCSVGVHRENWTAMGSCDVTMTYSAFGQYEFYILESWQPLPEEKVSTRVFEGRRPYFPTPFNFSDGEIYYQGTYTYSWPLPVLDGTYFHYMFTFPGDIRKQTDVSFVIERPSPPSVQCEGALRDAGQVCVCSTSSVGSPAGRLIWFSGDTVLASGNYGVTSLQFPINPSDGDQKSLQITCQLDWIIRQNVSITINTECLSSDGQTGAASHCVTLDKVLLPLLTLMMMLTRSYWMT